MLITLPFELPSVCKDNNKQNISNRLSKNIYTICNIFYLLDLTKMV